MKTLNYISRISDKLLRSLLESTGAVLVEGAKWCGKTQSSLQLAGSVVYMQDPDEGPGYLAIADLYPEDGSFHGEGFEGHKGFDTNIMADKLRGYGFGNISARKCFVINKKISENDIRDFEVFLLVAFRGPEI